MRLVHPLEHGVLPAHICAPVAEISMSVTPTYSTEVLLVRAIRSALSLAAGALAVLAASSAVAQGLPASGDEAKARLDSSPRHGEWVTYDAGAGGPVTAWVVYPERSDKAPVVVVIHEIYGLTDWIRAVADQLAAEGFIAIAPDLLSGKGPDGAGTDSFDRQGAVSAIRSLEWSEVVRRLNGAADYAKALPAALPAFASIGFCWGGSTSFRYSTAQPALDAAVVYYGGAPAAEELANITAPVLGLYGGDDARVNATIEPAEAEMVRLNKFYEYQIFDGAGHGFLRQQSGREGANRLATEKAWPLTVMFLKRGLGDE